MKKKLSPMMEQYLCTKEENKDSILFYRVGDFYEMFFEDAELASKELELVLTGKDCGLDEKAPMCGIPFHAADTYIARLVEKGYKVAIGEQVEDPRLAKGLVKREVVRIITPGTITAENVLDETRNNFLMSVFYSPEGYGVSTIDISTGEFITTELKSNKELMDEISRFSPSEIISNKSFVISGIDTEYLQSNLNILITELADSVYDERKIDERLKNHFHSGIEGLGLKDFCLSRLSAGAILYYIEKTQKTNLKHISGIRYYQNNQYMIIDTATKRNLELTETMREKKKKGSLLWVLDRTKTAMGARLLRRFIEQPLIDREEIIRRQDGVEELLNNYIKREEIGELLKDVYDLERILGRISYKTANPRDLIAFKISISVLPKILKHLSSFTSPIISEIYDGIDALEDIFELIENSIVDEPPLAMKDGGLIKRGYHKEVDEYKDTKLNGKKYLSELEASEREKTDIKNLKIKYNRVFGYCFEVTNSYKDRVPEYFIRKQTLTNSERYTTDELTDLQNHILGADEKLKELEYHLFSEIRDKIGENIERVQKTSLNIALLDTLISLSKTASAENYVRPSINTKKHIDIKDGRHPVIEKLMRYGIFVSNDTYLDNENELISVITGPNMAGKSTYMRQVALIVLMASIGSFVPASSADICICDRIFTRVGASDDLASGQSTFMVEMNEVANILRNATENSLLILDEIGRGTSTFDGLSIAWAVIEYITMVLKSKTLFATHYHELTELEGRILGVNNYCIAVTKHDDEIIFLRKIIPGGADKSYGIDVASLAGVPVAVIKRAKEISSELSDADILKKTDMLSKNNIENIFSQETLSSYTRMKRSMQSAREEEKRLEMESEKKNASKEKEIRICESIEKLDLNNMTPMDALNALYKLKESL